MFLVRLTSLVERTHVSHCFLFSQRISCGDDASPNFAFQRLECRHGICAPHYVLIHVVVTLSGTSDKLDATPSHSCALVFNYVRDLC